MPANTDIIISDTSDDIIIRYENNEMIGISILNASKKHTK
ncbi:MAG: DUF2283 domain-containing protein [Cyclobacteriaceae bacterium]